MTNKIYNKSNGLWYEQQGDYLLPCVTTPDSIPIGVWGQRHLRYIKEHRKVFYTALQLSGKLNDHLADIDRQADTMFFQLVNSTAKAEGITEQLKATDQMAWVGAMNNIRQRVTELVNREVIFA